MLKAVGLILIIIAGTGLGFSKCFALSEREKNLKSILRMVILLKGEISYGHSSLPDAFAMTSEKMQGKFGEFLKETSLRMMDSPGMRFGQIFRECVQRKLHPLYLTKEEEEALLSLGEHLGYLDLNMQIRQLEMFEKELIFWIENLQAEIPEKKKIFQSLGILGGILLAVLFI